jgi:hypothetical protein
MGSDSVLVSDVRKSNPGRVWGVRFPSARLAVGNLLEVATIVAIADVIQGPSHFTGP